MLDIKEIREKTKNLTILIVDDEPEIRETTNLFMQKFFSKTEMAENGVDALVKFNEFGEYDVVLTDVEMPAMNGRELIQKIKEVDEKVFIAVLSGSLDYASELKDSSNMYITKPAGLEEIKKLLINVIEYYKL